MPLFRCEAMGSAGDAASDQIEAANADEALLLFRARGLFVTKVIEVTKIANAGTSSTSSAPAQSKLEELPPGSRLQCHVNGKQLVLYIPPSSSMSVGFLGWFPVLFMGGIVVLTVTTILMGFRGGDYWLCIPLGLLWLAGLGLLYFWLRGRFGKTFVLVEPGRLVTGFELFGRQRMQEHALDENSSASLETDFYEGGRQGGIGKPVNHVRVTTADHPAKFGTFLTDEDKKWLVARINRHLGHEPS